MVGRVLGGGGEDGRMGRRKGGGGRRKGSRKGRRDATDLMPVSIACLWGWWMQST